jgi:hypothetical protein
MSEISFLFSYWSTIMTKLRYFLCAASLFAVTLPGAAKGAIEAVSFLNTDDFGLFVDLGGVPGAPITSGVQLTVTSALFTSDARANIFSIPGGPISTTAGGVTPAGLDTAIAQEGSAVLNNSLFPAPFGVGAPAPYGTNLGAPVPHALGDTAGSGSIIAGLGFPFGADIRKTAQADLAPGGAPGGFDIGTADASDTSTGSFGITVAGGPLSILAVFDASKFLLADLTPSPPGSAAAASASFSISITNAAGVSVFEWAPNGLPGGITGGTEYADPFSLNTSVTAAPGTSSSDIATSLVGFGGAGPFRAGVTLPAGTYSFNITETVAADVSSVGVIPEPSTIAVWALLALCGGNALCARSLRRA